MRGSVHVALPLVACSQASVLPLTAQQTFKSGTNLVVVPVVVVDGKGAMVDRLTVERAQHGLRMVNALTDQGAKAPHSRTARVSATRRRSTMTGCTRSTGRWSGRA